MGIVHRGYGLGITINDFNKDRLIEVEHTCKSKGIEVLSSVFDVSDRKAFYQFSSVPSPLVQDVVF